MEKPCMDHESRLSKIEEWQDFTKKAFTELSKDVKSITWKLAVATGFLAALQLFAPFMWGDVVEAFESLIK